jgi:hypothetical protein
VELFTSAELYEFTQHSLAQNTFFAQNNFGNTRSGSLAGPIGGFLIVALVVTTILLIRNMNARLRRLPRQFPSERTEPAAEPERAGSEGAGLGVERGSGESTEQTYRKRAG